MAKQRAAKPPSAKVQKVTQNEGGLLGKRWFWSVLAVVAGITLAMTSKPISMSNNMARSTSGRRSDGAGVGVR